MEKHNCLEGHAHHWICGEQIKKEIRMQCKYCNSIKFVPNLAFFGRFELTKLRGAVADKDGNIQRNRAKRIVGENIKTREKNLGV